MSNSMIPYRVCVCVCSALIWCLNKWLLPPGLSWQYIIVETMGLLLSSSPGTGRACLLMHGLVGNADLVNKAPTLNDACTDTHMNPQPAHTPRALFFHSFLCALFFCTSPSFFAASLLFLHSFLTFFVCHCTSLLPRCGVWQLLLVNWLIVKCLKQHKGYTEKTLERSAQGGWTDRERKGDYRKLCHRKVNMCLRIQSVFKL